MVILEVGIVLICPDRQTDIAKLLGSFRHYANALDNGALQTHKQLLMLVCELLHDTAITFP
jgi:hypothetical protein